jgi:hypothetical protein
MGVAVAVEVEVEVVARRGDLRRSAGSRGQFCLNLADLSCVKAMAAMAADGTEFRGCAWIVLTLRL